MLTRRQGVLTRVQQYAREKTTLAPLPRLYWLRQGAVQPFKFSFSLRRFPELLRLLLP